MLHGQLPPAFATLSRVEDGVVELPVEQRRGTRGLLGPAVFLLHGHEVLQQTREVHVLVVLVRSLALRRRPATGKHASAGAEPTRDTGRGGARTRL